MLGHGPIKRLALLAWRDSRLPGGSTDESESFLADGCTIRADRAASADGYVARDGVLETLDQPFVFSALERKLEADEKIFTSMDVKPICDDRARLLDPERDRATLARLSDLARSVFAEFGIETLIRLDIRADEDGNLFILEANPKPDLKAPAEGKTSLVSIGLSEHGMSYDDLILSVFANRIERLLADGHETVCRLAGV